MLIFCNLAIAKLGLPLHLEKKFSKDHPTCFLIKKLGKQEPLIWNKAFCQKRQPPQSTFKIFNSLIALEAKVIKSTDMIPWDKKPKFLKSWEKNHNLKSAIKYSVVPFYQNLAKRIGLARMQVYIDALGYGNRQLGSEVDKFWLGGPLEISPLEQMELMERLYLDQLPFKQAHQAYVRKILIDHQNAKSIVSGKTGSAFSKGTFVFGWYVGHIQKGNEQYVFVISSKGVGESGNRLKLVAFDLLKDMELL